MSSLHFASCFSDLEISEGNILVGKREFNTTVMNIKLFIAETLVKANSGYISVWKWESKHFHDDCSQPGVHYFQCRGKKVGPF
jgi:hypothetical protein